MRYSKHRKPRKNRPAWMAIAGVVAGLAAVGVALVFSRGSGDRLPLYVRSASAQVQEAYSYAVAHPEVLRYMPCYCGCETSGHRDNEDCFVAQRHSNGRIGYEPMGAG